MINDVSQQLGNYRLIRLLGQGGFAQVYLGTHIHLGTEAAIKVLTTGLTVSEIEQFHTEARIIAYLKHSQIVRILEFGIAPDGKTPFFVMEYAFCGTMRQHYPKGTYLAVVSLIKSRFSAMISVTK